MEETKKEVLQFQSEVKQLLGLMVYSLYSNRDIFIRELISNASDAINKLKFIAISDSSLYEKEHDFEIRISLDKKNKTISIRDNGIGMSKSDIIKNLGTIAKSGTKEFLKFSKDCDKKNINQLIGQFGVGFYSSFIVSKKVIVKSRLAGSERSQGVLWESEGTGEYSIKYEDKVDRGTEVILHVKEDQEDLLSHSKLSNIIKRYSNHIDIPIKMKTVDRRENRTFWKQINLATALWRKDKSNISENEYREFYKNLFKDSFDPIFWMHNKVEGTQEYISLMFIPSKSSIDLWNREKKGSFYLYVRRVFIKDISDQVVPNYLRFIRGLIDSEHLSLNISREILQKDENVRKLKKQITRRILNSLEMLSKNHPEKYQMVWDGFGSVLKEGPAEDISHKSSIINLLRFSSTFVEDEQQTVSLREYCDRAEKGQNKIYYLTADNYISAKKSPHLDCFKNQNIEVLLLYDRIDEWMMNYIFEFRGKEFQSISKNDSFLEDTVTQRKNDIIISDEKIFQPFLKRVKMVLEKDIKDVHMTCRLEKYPCVLKTDKNEMSSQMAKLFSSVGQSVPPIKYDFFLNRSHPIINKIMKIEDENLFSRWVKTIFNQALLIEQGYLKDVNQFIIDINQLLSS
ncbi:molecular chaperone HtpG [Candidatus Riesia pediculischaeffi]|uniref:Chaperone protein HtpG n=1 Tax=Candidatus Riesia pediculischaeffi TaxID=428411 RepID=A0A1V0HKG2_9ENTR|nr:molecular chaperone HtpG [Candidatus Riesia pediculischaeffi]ARC53314.1 heat-shock protein Hsp90 [Candidatus Riesia pediculischaeffi]